MSHRLNVVKTRIHNGELIVSMTCPDCPGVAMGSRRDIHEDDVGDLDAKVADMLASVQGLHDIDLRYGRFD
jgi:uncharacterized secreted protein with C-terminal beta-propeller domain